MDSKFCTVYHAFDVMKIDLRIKHHGGWQVSFVFHFSEANLTANITITDISNIHLNRSKNILVNNTQKIIHKDIILTTYRKRYKQNSKFRTGEKPSTLSRESSSGILLSITNSHPLQTPIQDSSIWMSNYLNIQCFCALITQLIAPKMYSARGELSYLKNCHSFINLLIKLNIT